MKRILQIGMLLLTVVVVMSLIGKWWSWGRENWDEIGELPKEFIPEVTSIGNDGIGVIGGFNKFPGEGSQRFRLSMSTAVIWRVEDERLEQVYQAPGRIQTLHHTGSNWFGVAATLKPNEAAGSDYRLIGSVDRGKTWKELGAIPATSIVRILAASSSVIYVVGASEVMASGDGGKTWEPRSLPPEQMKFYSGSAAIADNGDLLGFGDGLMRMSFQEASWQRILPAQYKVEAVAEPFLIAEVDGRVQLLRLTQQGVSVIGEFPEDRYPVRIVANEETIRVLTQLRDPSAAGFFSGGLGRALYRSKDGGSSWKATRLGSIQIADISGESAGLGISVLRNSVFLSK